jgi:hypothetical protein
MMWRVYLPKEAVSGGGITTSPNKLLTGCAPARWKHVMMAVKRQSAKNY